MNRYKNILLATDLHDDSKVVVETAVSMASRYEAKLHIAHVLEPITVGYPSDTFGWAEQLYSLQSDIRNESLKKLNKLAADIGVPEDNCHLVEGRAADAIHQVATDNQIDLVVMGTHGQAGLQLLLGSTANGVLHGCDCDVMAIRIRDTA